MGDVVVVQCPHCLELVEVFVEIDLVGTMVVDCEVCCRPWQMTIERDSMGTAQVSVERA